MSNKELIKKILKEIESKYKSLSSPQFFFIRESIELRPYERLIEEMKDDFFVEDNTDMNNDVCFFLTVEQESQLLNVQISLVGAYAAILKDFDGLYFPVDEGNASTKFEKKIVDVLKKNDILILGKDILQTPVKINLSASKPCVYNALFSDVEWIPWTGESQLFGS